MIRKYTAYLLLLLLSHGMGWSAYLACQHEFKVVQQEIYDLLTGSSPDTDSLPDLPLEEKAGEEFHLSYPILSILHPSPFNSSYVRIPHDEEVLQHLSIAVIVPPPETLS